MAEKITTQWVDRASGSAGERSRSRRFRVDICHRDDGWLYMLVDRSPEWIGPFTRVVSRQVVELGGVRGGTRIDPMLVSAHRSQ